MRQREKLQQHVARLREESCTVDATVSLMQRGIPCCETMTDLQFTLQAAGSLAQLAAMSVDELVAATPLTETEAVAMREFFDVESARL